MITIENIIIENSSMTNEEIVLLIQRGQDTKHNMELLYTKNKRFIYKTVRGNAIAGGILGGIKGNGIFKNEVKPLLQLDKRYTDIQDGLNRTVPQKQGQLPNGVKINDRVNPIPKVETPAVTPIVEDITTKKVYEPQYNKNVWFGSFGKTKTSLSVRALVDEKGIYNAEQLAKLSNNEIKNVIKQEFPNLNLDGYTNKFQILDAYGNEIIKSKGYDAIAKKGEKTIVLNSNNKLPMPQTNPASTVNSNIGKLPPKPLNVTQGQNIMSDVPMNKPFPNPNIKPLPPASARISTNKDLRIKDSGKFQQVKDKAYTELFDNQNPIQTEIIRHLGDTPIKADANPKILANNYRQVGATVDTALEHYLPNKNGEKIGDSLETIIRKVPKEKQTEFYDYLAMKHNVDRWAENKPLFKSVSPEQSKQLISKYENSNPNFKEIAETYYGHWDVFMKEWYVDSGLGSIESYDAMKVKYPNYIPGYRNFGDNANVPGGSSSNFGKTIKAGNVIKKAVGGDSKLLSLDQQMADIMNKTMRAAKKNEIYLSILKQVRENPEKLGNSVKVLGEGEKIAQQGSDVLDNTLNTIENGLIKTPNSYIVTAMEHGAPVQMQVNKELFDGLSTLSGSEGKTIEMFKKGFGIVTSPFKAVTTGYNPIFVAKNVMRDLQTGTIQSIENNPAKFMLKYGEATKKIVTNDKDWQEFKALGGTRSTLVYDSNKGWVTKANDNIIAKGLKGTANAIRTSNEITEAAPRFAEYLITLDKFGRNYEGKTQGIFNAGELSVNFARHGNVSKAIDIGVPYFNASMQGIDKTVRQVKNKPLPTIGKGLIGITAPALVLKAINNDNPNYDLLDNSTKDNFFNIPNPVGEWKDGKPATFIKIPKNREYGVIMGAIAERLANIPKQGTKAFEGVADSVVGNFLPPNPMESFIGTPAYKAMQVQNGNSNVTNWAGQRILPRALEGYSTKLQYDENTSEIAKFIGDKLNVSPVVADYLIKSYTGGISQFVQPVTTANVSKKKNPFEKAFVADPVYNNDVANKFYEMVNKVNVTAKDNNRVNNINSKAITPQEVKATIVNKIAKQITDINKQILVETDVNKIRDLRRQVIRIQQDALNKNFDVNLPKAKPKF